MNINYLKALPAVVVLFGGLSLSACNTVRGAGEDVEATGEAVQDAAAEVEDDMTDGDPN